jgi:hypothetical protein
VKFRTESGSIYETDPDRPRIRRLSGNAHPTPQQGPDGEWKDYAALSDITEGKPCIIGWRFTTVAGAIVMLTTVTSAVTAIT